MSIDIQQQIKLKQANTFGLDATARYYYPVTSAIQLQKDLPFLHQVDAPLWALGGGSNILFTKSSLNLIVLHNLLSGIHLVKEDEQHVLLNVAAGENWHRFVRYTLHHGWSGLENLSLIPGCVGAAPIQNIGAYGVELKDHFVELHAIDLQTGKMLTFNHADCQFSYRNSIFKNDYKNRCLITDITLKLNKQEHLQLNYAGIKQQLSTMNIQSPTATDVSEAIIAIRQEKLPDPKHIGNAGSFFKNPIITTEHYQQLNQQFPKLPAYELNQSQRKLPAAWLIEFCGFKGKRLGNIGVHDKQPLVLVNHGDGSGQALLDLAHTIQKCVKDTFDINLEAEVNIVE